MAAEVVREWIRDGVSWEEAARRLIHEHDIGPIASLKLLRHAGLPLSAGKGLVDQLLPLDEQAANQRIRDLAFKAIHNGSAPEDVP